MTAATEKNKSVSNQTPENAQEKTQQPIRAVLFDLDGTLVDTAKDFVRILRDLATAHNLQVPTDEQIRWQVSAGSKAMVSLFVAKDDASTTQQLSEQQIDELRQEFLDTYESNICVDSCLFTDLAELLEQLDDLGVAWGVVTNKPRYLAEKLLAALELAENCAVLVCPEDVNNSKPEPEPMYLAMDTLGIAKQQAKQVIYIGDHIRDIQAGNSAGNITIAAGYGYLSTADDISSWQANHVVATSGELVALLKDLVYLKDSVNTTVN